MTDRPDPHFSVHPSVVYQLGESLISDSVQALIELVKNCYDADARYAKVTIDTKGSMEVSDALFEPSGGRIIVEDDGHGMNLDDIQLGWLMISNRKKRELKESKKTTPGGRTPLGDKGLGRLGVQRLGEHLEIFTKAKGHKAYHFGFSWLDFQTAPRLEDVAIHLSELRTIKHLGTKVVITRLREPGTWLGERALKQLEQELSRMISPYKTIRDFRVIVEIDGKTLELLEISERVRNIAPIKYSFRFDGERISMVGCARLGFFQPSDPKEAEFFSLMAESDDGRAFFEFLNAKGRANVFKLVRSKSKKWFIEFHRERALSDLDKVEHVSTDDRGIANPGPFFGEVDAFDLGSPAFQRQSVFDRVREYRRHIKDLSGIRVYRDGFAIRVDHDWLKLGGQWTSASSYYGLKPDTTLGYVALSARENIVLEETTDREGFKDSPYYRNFYGLLQEFITFTSKAHEFFGRSWAEFRKQKNEDLARVDAHRSIEDLSRSIKERVGNASDHQERLKALSTRLSKSANAASKMVRKLQSAKSMTPVLQESVNETLTDLNALLYDARLVSDQSSKYLGEIRELRDFGQVIEDRVDSLRRQVDDMYEAVALGLTAEGLSHEIFNIADVLAQRTKAIQLTSRSGRATDRQLITFFEYVQSAVIALRRQVSFLSPSLRYVRDQRHVIDVREFVGELVEFYQPRFKKSALNVEVKSTNSIDFTVQMNRGKLTQAIDNLVLNSEYWLKEAVSQGRMKSGTLSFELDRPFIRVFDDGMGIDPIVESALFEPFISMKAKGAGRGLGLFVSKQLLDSEACSIGVLPERNRHKRLFKFQIDLRGAFNG